MGKDSKYVERKKWFAAVMGMTMPGMGQIYNGELIKGISFLAIFLILFASGCRIMIQLPDKFLLVGALAIIIITVVLFLTIIVDAYRRTNRYESGYHIKSYNRWYFYLAIWLLGSVLVSGLVYNYVKKNFVEAYKIVGTSMAPVVIQGDRVFADKTAYNRMAPKKGDIILFVYPDDRSKVFIRKIEGMPGDVITLMNGKKDQVPHGMIFVIGDNKEHSMDSREFGYIPLRDVIGKARQIFYSSGDEGVRWNRIGLVLGGA